MNEFKYDYGIELVRLGDDETEYDGKLTSEDIDMKKRAARMLSTSHKKAKLKQCILCEKESSSFCNSHSVPKFALNRISDNGMISKALQGKMLFYEKSIGINQAGTFQIICNSCDNECFQQYENPNAYSKEPTNEMLAQMALKNYLLLVYKKLVTRETYILIGKKYPEIKDLADEKAFIEDFDFNGYLARLRYAQKATENPDDKRYHLCYYKVLDYVVPYTAQSAITLVGGFNDEIINNVYKFYQEYEIKEIHVAVFPLKTTSVVMLFIEEGEKRYRQFYRQLKKLPLEDQLATINYIIFTSIEDVFINPKTQEKLRHNKEFMDACRLTTDTVSIYDSSPDERILKAIKEFSLSKRSNIPNLLSREYAISSDNKDE